MKKFVLSLSLSVSFFLLFIHSALACTDFRITAKDSSVVITRSMEFALDLKSNLRSSPRGRVFTTVAPNGQPGMTWKTKYGYVFLDGLNVDAAVDGMNEAGLSIEDLFLPNLAQYQTVPSGQEAHALPYLNFGDWVLGNFKTVDEVRAALATVFVFPQKMTGLGDMIFPLHFAVYDATGKGIVVEYIGGKLSVYDSIGVMTNAPAYPWHVTNLQNYLHLSPTSPSAVKVSGVTYLANGQGFGMLGLPGDISPPSRFVKVATLLHVTIPPEDATGAINLGEHVINNVDIPLGLAREPNNAGYSSELTQWVVFKDLTHKVFYYRTYTDMTLHSIALSQIDFSENATRVKMPIASSPTVVDMTQQFIKSAMTAN